MKAYKKLVMLPECYLWFSCSNVSSGYEISSRQKPGRRRTGTVVVRQWTLFVSWKESIVQGNFACLRSSFRPGASCSLRSIWRGGSQRRWRFRSWNDGWGPLRKSVRWRTSVRLWWRICWNATTTSQRWKHEIPSSSDIGGFVSG